MAGIDRNPRPACSGIGGRHGPEYARRRATLVIARLDRLARNLYVIVSLMESRVEFVAADMPSANKLTIQLIAAIAEHERDQISRNTKAALKAAQQRGVVLGNPRIADARVQAISTIRKDADAFSMKAADLILSKGYGNLSLNKVATLLNTDGIPTQRGRQWTATGVKRVRARARALDVAAEQNVPIAGNELGLGTSRKDMGAEPIKR